MNEDTKYLICYSRGSAIPQQMHIATGFGYGYFTVTPPGKLTQQVIEQALDTFTKSYPAGTTLVVLNVIKLEG